MEQPIQIEPSEFTLNVRTSDLEPEHSWEERNTSLDRFKEVYREFPIEKELSNPEAQSSPYIEVNNENTHISVMIEFERVGEITLFLVSVYFRDSQKLMDSDKNEFRITTSTSTFKTANSNFVEYLMKVFFDNNPSELNELLRHTSESKVHEGISVEIVKYLTKSEFFGLSDES